MRIYGTIYTKFWSDPSIQKISDQSKILAIYLLSSTHTNMLGCFRIPVGYVVEDLKWDSATVLQAFDELTQINYLTYEAVNGWIFIHHFLKFNPIENPNQGKSIAKLFDEVPQDSGFISQLINTLDQYEKHLPAGLGKRFETVPEPFLNQDQEQDQEQKQEITLSGEPDPVPVEENNFKKSDPSATRKIQKSDAIEILEFLNKKTGRAYRPVDANLNLIVARLNSGATVGQCFQVIAKKYRDWKDDQKMSMYLRPETLFDKKKFESYLGELINPKECGANS